MGPRGYNDDVAGSQGDYGFTYLGQGGSRGLMGRGGGLLAKGAVVQRWVKEGTGVQVGHPRGGLFRWDHFRHFPARFLPLWSGVRN